ncbi:MAG: tryptophan--tRNA ligase [Provencibacterium sp.]|jgi:tryptophanyl-tRNA synthetase|nr:tryptophan--tRNA ligase [Provencibacterium sp.]
MEASVAPKRPVIFSGIQPTGIFTLGNYLGAIKNWAPLQEENDCIYSIVDEHAITVRQDPAKLRESALRALAVLIACGIDPKKSILFIQSHVPAHAQLSWVLSCYCQFGELGRMTQFKDKSQKNADNINAGLFTYPALMAADILLYQTNLVPVGEDQKQHLELSRDIAQRFNHLHGDTFAIPEPYIPKVGARIMSLQEPQKKMSKSDANVNAFITVLDDEDTILRKFKRAVTDSEAEVAYREGKDGVNNLMTIYSVVTGKGFEEIEREFAGKGYGDFKLAVGQAVADHMKPVREEFQRLYADKAYLKEVYREGAEHAAHLARRTLDKVYRKVGFVPAK